MARVWGCDTETDNDGAKAWIAQWALSDGRKEIHGTDDFLEGCLGYLAGIKGKHYVYFWNLKYDLEFIKYALYEMAESWNYELRIIRRKGNPVSITCKPRKERGIQSEIVIRDGMKKMRGSLREIAPIFGMEKLEGPDFVPGWSAREDFTKPEAWDYVHMDARIVAVAMQTLHRMGYTKATSSGDAWYTAKRMFATDKKGKYHPKNSMKWDALFPSLSYELDHDLRDGYVGGVNISHLQGEIYGDIIHDDMTSMYPTVMYWDPLPVGVPTLTEMVPAPGTLWVGKLRIKLHLKPHHIAWFQFKNGIDSVMEGMDFGDPVVDTKEYHNLTLTSVDWCSLQADYDVEEDPEPYGSYFYLFKSNTGMFRPYIDRFIKQKNESPKHSPERAQAKQMLNSLYGRYALIPDGEETSLEYSWDSKDLEWVTVPKETSEEMDSYLPVAMFTTAYARARLLEYVRAICAEDKDLKDWAMIHSDTDSVIFLGNRPKGLEYDNGLGTWANETRPVRMYEGGFKRYIEILHEPVRDLDDIAMAAAGVPQKVNHLGVPVGMWVELLDDPALICGKPVLGHHDYVIKSKWLRDMYKAAKMNPDRVNTMKLLPRKVPGGVILDEHTHKLSDNMGLRLRR